MDPVWAETETEILVHAAAPSLALHDTYYRALASAYIDFLPARTTRLAPARDGGSSVDCPSSAGVIDSPQLSFEDVWDNAGSPPPALHPCPDGEALAADSQSSLSIPPSEVEDSQPFHHLRLGIQPLHHDGEDTAPSPGRADFEPLSGEGVGSAPRPRELTMIKSLSDLGPSRPELPHETRAASQGGLGARLADVLEVFAPEPDCSFDDLEPSSLLTYNLIKLDSDLGLLRRFTSKRQLLHGREPRPTERGFWELACSGWDAKARQETWGYLAGYVGEGRAGWGVWLKRDAATNNIRLFSFGHTMGHMYLLLYTATRRRILSLDCTWTSGGDGLIFVPATKNGWDV